MLACQKTQAVTGNQAGSCLVRVHSLCIHITGYLCVFHYTPAQYEKRRWLTLWIAGEREKHVDYSSNYWSASPNANNSNNAWNVNFNNGNSNNNNKSNNNYVRLVRDGE